MVPLKASNGTWCKERCAEEAKKYQSRAEFDRGSPSAYAACLRHGWMDEVCSHMKPLRTSWTKEMCAEVARKYGSRSTFATQDGAAYQAAAKRGWLDEICSHMKRPIVG
jgi:hypothetical protein